MIVIVKWLHFRTTLDMLKWIYCQRGERICRILEFVKYCSRQMFFGAEDGTEEKGSPWPAKYHRLRAFTYMYIYIYTHTYIHTYTYTYIYIYIYIYTYALQSSSRDCPPPNDLALSRPIVPRAFFSEGVYFHRHRYLH